MRSVMPRRLSSRGMPRFCSSNTRPNSLLIGSGISVATMLKPKPRLCPERSERASISRASGSCAAKAFSRRLRRISSHTSGSTPSRMPHQRHQRGVDAHHGPQADSRSPPAPPRSPASLAMVRFVSACSNSRLMLPNRSTNDCDDARPVVQRLGEDAGFFGRGVLGGGSARRRSTGRGGPRSCWPACRAAAGPRRPPARRLPRTPERQSAEDSRLSPPS